MSIEEDNPPVKGGFFLSDFQSASADQFGKRNYVKKIVTFMEVKHKSVIKIQIFRDQDIFSFVLFVLTQKEPKKSRLMKNV